MPLPKQRTVELHVGCKTLEVEVLDQPDTMCRGLKFREELPEGTGMLFVFQQPLRAVFWAEGCKFPLDVAFVDVNGFILEITHLEAEDESMVHSWSDQVSFVIETTRGWFERNEVFMGSRVEGLGGMSGHEAEKESAESA